MHPGAAVDVCARAELSSCQREAHLAEGLLMESNGDVRVEASLDQIFGRRLEEPAKLRAAAARPVSLVHEQHARVAGQPALRHQRRCERAQEPKLLRQALAR
eukprot:CAMPEP_0119402782 /NCGR_PEP_ID=MMETSP1334-20130426/143054_1 /TAXON_ID=127549 /ORGANISM="Calcidiscus leptoporus, Strain RCC1130" /LENGTH=101 /DNA_ID=CAMNT_0007426719 /DNA_START=810 /DNA_END=1111 /DNA_ORIENTATION=+